VVPVLDMGFTKEQLEEYRDRTVPDLVGGSCRLLFVGINPGLWTAATQTHFCHPSNRFYPALRVAGLIDFDLDTASGMSDEQRLAFTSAGMGITNLVERATVRASELSRDELEAGGAKVADVVASIEPTVVAVLGITAYRTAFGKRGARVGLQDLPGAAQWWVLPNPSGLNAHVTIADLATEFRAVAEIAGVQ
jgi:double-stranded uracil-DNA glycosylase